MTLNVEISSKFEILGGIPCKIQIKYGTGLNREIILGIPSPKNLLGSLPRSHGFAISKGIALTCTPRLTSTDTHRTVTKALSDRLTVSDCLWETNGQRRVGDSDSDINLRAGFS